MRFSLKKYLIFLFFVFIALFTWNLLFKNYDNIKYTQTCNLPDNYHQELHKFTDDIHKILNVLNLTHFLCYGSLWGEIRFSKLLPWEDKSVLCLVNDEFASKDEVSIVRLFRKSNFHIEYEAMEGQYVVTKDKNDPKMKVLLVLFELNKVVNMYRRIGWKRRVLPPDCDSMESLNCFPPRLIMPPLPIKEFGKYLIPVPREGIELQKYLYRNNWWEELPLKNC